MSHSGTQSTMPIHSPFSYVENMHVSPQFPAAPSLGFGAPSTPGEILYSIQTVHPYW